MRISDLNTPYYEFVVETTELNEDMSIVRPLVSKEDFQAVLNDVNQLWNKLSMKLMMFRFDIHVVQRINERKIMLPDLRNLFRDVYRIHGKELQQIAIMNPKFSGVMRDKRSFLNVPFETYLNGDDGVIDVRISTAMRKEYFKSWTPFFRV